MSREVYRVPLDFDAPLDEEWEGYVMPKRLQPDRCPDCVNGSTAARAWIETLCHRIDMLVGDVADQDHGKRMHPWLADDPYPACGDFPRDVDGKAIGYAPIVRPSRDIVDLFCGLTGMSPERALDPMRGHTSGIETKLIEAAGLDPQAWGICPTCDGRAVLDAYEGQRTDAAAWQRTDPPVGDGWQLWTTVTAGSPISPVFEHADDLAAWMVDNGEASSIAVARRFVAAGWAPSGISTDETGFMDGVEFVGRAGGR